jgi:Na+/H+-dicarboxylate symporter
LITLGVLFQPINYDFKVLGAVGIPVTGLAFILGVDCIPDMFRSNVNVIGEGAAAGLVDEEANKAGSKSN